MNNTEIHWKKAPSSRNGATQTGCLCLEYKYTNDFTKLKYNWIKDFSIKPDIFKQVEEKMGNSFELIGTGKDIVIRTSLTQALG